MTSVAEHDAEGNQTPLGDREPVGGDGERRVMVEASPAAAFVVTEADLLLELLERWWAVGDVALRQKRTLGVVALIAFRCAWRWNRGGRQDMKRAVARFHRHGGGDECR